MYTILSAKKHKWFGLPNEKCPECKNETNDDYFAYWYIEQQPILTEEEIEQNIKQLNKCADFILKNGITPNLE